MVIIRWCAPADCAQSAGAHTAIAISVIGAGGWGARGTSERHCSVCKVSITHRDMTKHGQHGVRRLSLSARSPGSTLSQARRELPPPAPAPPPQAPRVWRGTRLLCDFLNNAIKYQCVLRNRSRVRSNGYREDPACAARATSRALCVYERITLFGGLVERKTLVFLSCSSLASCAKQQHLSSNRAIERTTNHRGG